MIRLYWRRRGTTVQSRLDVSGRDYTVHRILTWTWWLAGWAMWSTPAAALAGWLIRPSPCGAIPLIVRGSGGNDDRCVAPHDPIGANAMMQMIFFGVRALCTWQGVGTNRYAYSDNFSVNKSDPSGHQSADGTGDDGTAAAAASESAQENSLDSTVHAASLAEASTSISRAPSTKGSRTGRGLKGAAQGAARAGRAGAIGIAVGAAVGVVSSLNDDDNTSSKPVLALDTNTIIAAVEKGRLADVEAAIAGRRVVVPPTAYAEAIKGQRGVMGQLGTMIAVNSFKARVSATFARHSTSAEALSLQAQAQAIGRTLGLADAHIAAQARSTENATVITNDISFSRTMDALGIANQRF
jgi:predicted nucleic acid-binding protein